MIEQPTRQFISTSGYKAPDLSDLTMEHWEVLSYAGCVVRGKPWYLCRCRCGTTALFPIRRLTGFRVKNGKPVRVVGPSSCGCKPDGRRINRIHKPANGNVLRSAVRNEVEDAGTDKAVAKSNEHRSIKPKKRPPIVVRDEVKDDEDFPTSQVGFPLSDLRAMIEGRLKLPIGVEIADLEWQLAARTRRRIRYRV